MSVIQYNWIKILFDGQHDIDSVNTSFGSDTVHFRYPCSDPSTCSPYKIYLSPGKFRFSLCGGNGGVSDSFQISERKETDTPYAGGCSSGVIRLNQETSLFIHVGGRGNYSSKTGSRAPGGYNGGGSGNNNPYSGCSGGGGASDIRAEVDDVFHRIIVSGGGGGGDDFYGSFTPLNNDGRGGSGGGLVAQGWYQSGSAVSFPVANETFGFSFGYGESSNSNGSLHTFGSSYASADYEDVGGAGGGWFGGFASHFNNYGAGGGSSFAITKPSPIADSLIEERDNNFELISIQKYAYFDCDKYCFSDVVHERGVWYGNGHINITLLSTKYDSSTCYHYQRIQPLIHLLYHLVFQLVLIEY